MLPPIVCISNAEWDAPLPTNRQQIMRRFAQRTEVAYIEAPLPVVGAVVGRSRGRTRQRGWREADGVRIFQAWDWPPYPLSKRSLALSRWMDSQFRGAVTRAWSGLGWERPIAWFYTPDGGDLLGAFGERLRVYHCVDDYQAAERFNGYRRVAIYDERKTERYLVGAVDQVIVTAPSLFERWRTVNSQTALMPNVADTALFAQALDVGSDHPCLEGIPTPRVVFMGALDRYKVDLELLGEVARILPAVQFILIGPIGAADQTNRAQLPQGPNIHMIGHLPQRELPAALRRASVGVIPYALNEYTASVSPLKLYEYLAAGLPVVVTPLPALLSNPVDGALIAAPDPEAFAARLVEAMGYDTQARHRLAHRAATQDWERRMTELEALLTQRLAVSAAALS
jgi:glycosyltransferase involved in cell wall biosynthesis